jgi:cyclic pyranopterin phosphate synthase
MAGVDTDRVDMEFQPPGMRDVSEKRVTRRTATAQAVLRAQPETIRTIVEGRLPKGDPLPVAKVAAIQAAKNTSQIIPYCHPLPVEHLGVEFAIEADAIRITTRVVAHYKTGVEMEALTAAAVAALSIYDMAKMIDPAMAIEQVILLEKTGGKSDFARDAEPDLG